MDLVLNSLWQMAKSKHKRYEFDVNARRSDAHCPDRCAPAAQLVLCFAAEKLPQFHAWRASANIKET